MASLNFWNTQYVNCWEDHSHFSVLYRILDGIDKTLDIHRQSTSQEVLLDRLHDYDGPPYIIILDEADQLDTTVVFPTSAPLLCAPSLSVIVGVWVLSQSRLQNIVGAAVFITIGAVWQAVVLDFATVHRISSLPASSGRTDPPGSLRSA